MSSNKLCKACVLLEGLNRGLPKLGIGKTNALRKKYGLEEDDAGVGRKIDRFEKIEREDGNGLITNQVNGSNSACCGTKSRNNGCGCVDYNSVKPNGEEILQRVQTLNLGSESIL